MRWLCSREEDGGGADVCWRGLDYIIIGSDSGRIVVLEYEPETNGFNKLHQETYGRSGSRRIVPGQHIATDPKGRAVMIGAMEKSKLVYILNRVRCLPLEWALTRRGADTVGS